jgi:hypothetical protein
MRFVLAMVLLFLLLVLALQFPAVQTYVTTRAANMLSEQTGTAITVERIGILLPKAIDIRGIYLEDKQGDTLLYSGRLKIDVNLPGLLRNKLTVNHLSLSDVKLNITRLKPDSLFNYEFLLDALSNDEKSHQDPDKPAETSLPEAADGNSASWEFSVRRINLDDIGFRFADHHTGMDLHFRLGAFETSFDALDPAKMRFHIGNTQISDAELRLLMQEASVPPDPDREPSGVLPDIAMQKLLLENITFIFLDDQGFELTTALAHLETNPRRLDLQDMHFDLENFLVTGLLADIIMPASPGAESPGLESDASAADAPGNQSGGVRPDPVSGFSFHWDEIMPVSLVADVLHIADAEFSMRERNNATDPPAESANFELYNIELHMEALHISPDTIDAQLRQLSVAERGGPELRTMSGGFKLGKGAIIDQLLIETAGSRIEADLVTSVPVLQLQMPLDELHSLEKFELRGHIGDDLSAFVPGISEAFKHGKSPPVDFLFIANGNLQQIDLKALDINVDDQLRFQITDAMLQNITSVDSFFIDVPSWSLTSLPRAFMPKISEELQPAGLVYPESLSLSGSFTGHPDDFLMEADLQSDFVSMIASLALEQAAGQEPVWKMSAKLESTHPLAITGQDDLMTDLAFLLEADGTGFDPETMLSDVRLQIDSVCFGGYTYSDLILSASLNEGIIDALVSYDDEHLSVELQNRLDLTQTHPLMTADWHLEHLNAFELGFTDDLIALQTRITAEVALTSSDFFDGSIRFNDTHVLSGREVFTLDSLVVITSSKQGRYQADIRSVVLEATYRGNMSPAGIPATLAAHVNTYLKQDVFDYDSIDEPRFFNVSLTVFPSPYLSELIMPSLQTYKTIDVSAGFDSRTRIISLDLDIPEMEIAGWQIRDLTLKADSDPEYLDFRLQLPELTSEMVSLTNIFATGNLQEHKLRFDLSFDDMHEEAWLGISGELQQYEDYVSLRLDPDLMANRFYWQVLEGNELQIGESFLFAKDLVISAADKEISLLSTEPDNKESPVTLHMKNINLGEFDLLGGDPVVEGIFNGSVVLNDVFGKPSFTADLLVDGIGYEGSKFGDVSLFVDNPSPELFQVEASISGYGNIVDLKGSYKTDEMPQMDFNLNLAQLDLSTLEALTFDQLDDMEGIISGEMHLFGEPSMPGISGVLNFDSLGFHVAFLNARYNIPQASILFDDQKVIFDKFSLFDHEGRQASLDGHIFLAWPEDIRFDLNLSSSNFLAMNIPKGANELFYGRMLIDTDFRLSGDMGDPVVEGELKLNKGSSFAFIVPQYKPEAIGDEGVVEFVSIRDELFADLIMQPREPDPMMSVFENLDMSLNVEIDPETQVSIVIDEVAGDMLELRGGGVLSFGIDPGGRISLAGRYEINDGSYQMTFYDLIRRNFAIESGSTILWTGDPLSASMDITARYTVRTSPRELMATHSMSGGQQEPAYRRQYPFDVFLNMKGELMSPEISFRIALPQEHRGAMDGRLQARLNEVNAIESELNKQVFALLILGSFIQDDPLAAMTAGPGISATARSSASRLLSQQLNRLSDRYIRGVELSFEVESYEDYADGQMVGRTELQMEISRKFLDERLRITAGGNLELEDETRRQLHPSDIAGDFSVEYLITPDGRLIVKVYRERNFQDVFDGEVVETGLALIFRQTYNRFRELFRRKE